MLHDSLDNLEIKRDGHKTGKLPDQSQKEFSSQKLFSE